MTYKNLPECLDGWWDKSWHELPAEQRSAWLRAAGPLENPQTGEWWRQLEPEGRQKTVEQYDYMHAPQNVPVMQAEFCRLDEAAALAGLTALEAAKLLLIREGRLLERFGIPCADIDAPPLAKRLLELDEMRASGIDGTIHPLAEWLRRAREKDIAYIPGLDYATTVAVPNAPNTPSSKPPYQQRFQEQEILRVIDELGYSPMALPARTAGKPWVKSEVRAKLTLSKTVFDKAWERLRAQLEIQDA